MMFFTRGPAPTRLMRATMCAVALAANLLAVAPCGRLTAGELAIDRVLPSQTRLMVLCEDYPTLQTRFAQTQHGRIWHDPAMRGFRESILQRTVPFGESPTGLATITAAELAGVAAGTVSFAVLENESGKPAEVLFVNVAGKQQDAQALIQLASRRASDRGLPVTTVPHTALLLHLVGDRQLSGADAPVVVFLRDEWLVFARGMATAEQILERWSGEAAESLAAHPVYRQTMESCTAQYANREAEICWFVDPFAYAQLYFVFDPESEDIGPAAFAQRHGFDAVRGVAGNVHVGDAGRDLLVHVAIDVVRPAREALRIMEFPGGGNLQPSAWVAADVSAYTFMSWNLVRVIEYGAALLDDEFLGGIEGTFHDIVEDTRQDLRIDLETDLFARLGPAITQISEPATTIDQDNLIAVEVRESETVADVIKRLLRDDPDVRRLRVEGLPHDVWQIPNADLTSLNLSVTADYLLISTSTDLMSKFARPLAESQRLAGAAEWLRVEEAWQPFVGDETFLGAFSRPADDILAAYEYLRGGAVGTSDSLYVQLISQMTDVHDASAPDFSKLPPFEQIRRYFGPVGIVAREAETGWMVCGFVLPATVRQDVP